MAQENRYLCSIMLLASDAKQNTMSHSICFDDDFQNSHAVYNSGAPWITFALSKLLFFPAFLPCKRSQDTTFSKGRHHCL